MPFRLAYLLECVKKLRHKNRVEPAKRGKDTRSVKGKGKLVTQQLDSRLRRFHRKYAFNDLIIAHLSGFALLLQARKADRDCLLDVDAVRATVANLSSI